MSYSELAEAGILGKRQAEAFALRELEDHSREETAALMGVSPNTVDEHLATARSKIEAARRTVELVDGEGSA